MCYFLYGAINNGINSNDYEAVIKNSRFAFNYGDAEAVNRGVKNSDWNYRITSEYCDCKTELGQKKTGGSQLKELNDLLLELRNVRGVKYVLISKNWVDNENEASETVHIDDIDVMPFLANIEDNCLYKIELYKKYY